MALHLSELLLLARRMAFITSKVFKIPASSKACCGTNLMGGRTLQSGQHYHGIAKAKTGDRMVSDMKVKSQEESKAEAS